MEITRKMYEVKVARQMMGHNKTNSGHSAPMSIGTYQSQKYKIMPTNSMSKGVFVDSQYIAVMGKIIMMRLVKKKALSQYIA